MNAHIAPHIFKAYDIRGIVDQTLTEDSVYLIGRALGSEAIARGAENLFVARDGRLSGERLKSALIKGLLESGLSVSDAGMVPTGLLYFSAYAMGGGSGVMVTGSHNPPEYNGLKMVLAGTTLSGADIQSLRTRIEKNDFIKGSGRLSQADVIPVYLDRVCSDIRLKRPLNVIVDCGNGVAGAVAPELLRRLGCEVTELYCEVDGNFPNHHPDPSKPENLHDLIQAMEGHDYDVGLAFDGDGDRLGVVTPEGEIIWPDRQIMLYAMDILQRHPGAEIIYDIKCTSNLGPVIEAAGGRALLWKTGHSLIKAKLKETGALLAGEMSGHIFFKERWYGFDDAVYTAARLLEILAADPRPSEEVFRTLPDSVNTPELNLLMQEGEHFRYVEQLVARAQFPGARLTTIDGLRADFADGFGLVRASNTTPSLVIRFEGRDAAALERIKEAFRQQMLAVRPDLHLPF